MIYKEFQGERISALGFGTMRLPLKGKNDADIDEELAARMFDKAINAGVNYFDTAWGYHDHNSECVTGRILARYPRESFNLASKFPGYDLGNMTKVRQIFPKQLEKCGVEYFDFYLFHNVCELNIEAYLQHEEIYEYLLEQKAAGRIRHLGFSAHGSCEVIERFLDKYGAAMEFCQLQINYIDWTFQDAARKVELLRSRGIPVWVMEPVRGGKLARLDEKYEKQLKALRPEESIASWAFRFLTGIKDVTVILSGMSDMAQVEDNLKTFSQDKPLDEKERELLLGIAAEMSARNTLPCTACRYCTSYCPKGLDIPELIKLYNEHVFTGGGFLAPMAISSLAEDKRPSACIGCRSCEKVCPQGIKISEMMKKFTQALQG